jgi:hypothetical protein
MKIVNLNRELPEAKRKKDLLEIYRLNQKIKEMLPKDIQESMNLYLNNNIFEIEQEDNF